MWKHPIRFDIDCDHRGRTGRHIDPRWLPPPSCREGADGSRRNEPANRFACSTVASRLESKGQSGTITNLHQRPRSPVHSQRQPGASAAVGSLPGSKSSSRPTSRSTSAKSITVPALARFVYLSSTPFQPRIQAVIWNTAASLSRATTDRAKPKHCWQARHCRYAEIGLVTRLRPDRGRFRRRSERSQESSQPNIPPFGSNSRRLRKRNVEMQIASVSQRGSERLRGNSAPCNMIRLGM